MTILLLGCSAGILTADASPAAVGSSEVMYLPAAAHVSGAAGTSWRTDVELHNPGDEAVTVTVEALRHGQANGSPRSQSYDIGGGSAWRLDDVLLEEFGLQGTASLRLSTSGGELVASARTFNTTASGTYGQLIEAVGEEELIEPGEHGRLSGLHTQISSTDGFRTNLGLVNATGTVTDVQIELFTESGASLGVVEQELRAYEYVQLNRVYEELTLARVRNGWAAVWSETAGSGLYAYASVVDNATGDPVYVPAVVLSGAPSGEAGIEGTVTDGGEPAAGVSLSLVLKEGSSHSEVAATTTDGSGDYLFEGVDSLGASESYYVMYGPNESDSSRLYLWYGPYIESFSGEGTVAGGDFDIADVDLVSPSSGSELSLPATFSWEPRGIAEDAYTWFLYDPDDGDYWMSEDVGGSDSFTLTELPSGVVAGHDYLWWVLVWWGSDSYGESYSARYVSFEGKSGGASGEVRDERRPERLVGRVGELQSKDSGEAIVVPGCAHVSGAAGTDWRTDLVVHNPGAAQQTVTVEATPEEDSKRVAQKAEVTVAGGSSEEVCDVLSSMFGLSGSATLELSTGGDVLVSARTFNQTIAGTYGQLIVGQVEGEAIGAGYEGRLIQLSNHRGTADGYRTNLGLVNMSPTALDVEVDLYDGDGTLLGSLTESLPGDGYRQINRVFQQVTSGDVDDGYIVSYTQQADGSFLAYASVVDNRTGDPIYIPAVRRERQSPSGEQPQLTWLGGGGCYASGMFGIAWLDCYTFATNDGGPGNVELSAWAWGHPEEALTEVLYVEQGQRYELHISADLESVHVYTVSKVRVSSPQAQDTLEMEWTSSEWCLEGEINEIELEPDTSAEWGEESSTGSR